MTTSGNYGSPNPLQDLVYIEQSARRWRDYSEAEQLQIDALRILRIDTLLRFDREYSTVAAALSPCIFGEVFEESDITAFELAGDLNDPARCVCCFFAELVAVARMALEEVATVPAIRLVAAPELALVDNPGTGDLATVIPGDAKAASLRLLYGDAKPLVFKLAQPSARSESGSSSSLADSWRLQPFSAQAAVVSLAAGPGDAVGVLHVRSDSQSALHDVHIALVEGGTMVRVSGLPRGSDARDLRLRVEGVLLRPSSASTPDTAVFPWAAAWTGVSPAPDVLEVELYDPSLAAQIESKLETRG